MGSRDVVAEDDSGSLLDADGETDHESAVSVYILPNAPSTAHPAQRQEVTVSIPREHAGSRLTSSLPGRAKGFYGYDSSIT